jgi:class 3 adenylate cyclase/tetratricopeptide (TPR) repeat protein
MRPKRTRCAKSVVSSYSTLRVVQLTPRIAHLTEAKALLEGLQQDLMANEGDIRRWLAEQGFAKYAEAFASNAIGLDVLLELTDADLKDIGITALGDRKRLLKAIASLAAANVSTVVPTATAPAPTDAERRQITVLFCDLVGSTALANRLDAEDLRDVIRTYHACCTEIVAKFDGSIAQYLGDGVMVRFGYPKAHEDDADRAVRCGLDMIKAVAALKVPNENKLEVRIGIATGVVVVGDSSNSEVGETPNLAARLQSLAQPGSIVIADGTKKLIGNLFDCRDMGTVAIKGYRDPIHTWHVLALSQVESRFDALRSRELTPLIGREEELELLQRRWRQAKEGKGRVILLSGEPGIGKSRLVAAFAEQIANELHTRLQYFCSPYHQTSALYPVISQLGHAAGFNRDDDATARFNKLAALLARTATSPEDVALIADLLSLPVGDRYPALDLTPQQHKDKTFAALLRQFEALTRERPVMMVFEDVHWIDPSSRELLDLTIDRIQGLPILLLIIFRPEFEQPWTGQSPVTTLVLNRLDRPDGTALVRRMRGTQALPEDIIDDIVERTDGVPLFLEELTKAILESGAPSQEIESAVPAAKLAVPATLHASLMARLDRLGTSAKQTAQVGAAIGREFSYELLVAIAERPQNELQLTLDHLVGAGLVFQRGAPLQGSYLFKHALIQEAAYSTLLRSPRQGLHARIALALEEHFADAVEEQPEVLAHHFAEAGRFDKAVAYWLKAGRRAARRSANVEAIAHLQKGIAGLAALPEGPDRDRQELTFQLDLGVALMATRGWNAPDANTAYRRADELAQRIGDDRQRFQATWGLWIRASNYDARHAFNAELFRIAERLGDPALLLQAHHSAWSTAFYKPDLIASLEHIAEGLVLYDPEKHRAHAFLYGGHDAGVCGHANATYVQWLLGFPDQAEQSARQAVTLGERLSHPPSLAYALFFTALYYYFKRDGAAVLHFTERAIAIADEHGLAGYGAGGHILRGWALVECGEARQGLVELQRGIEAFAAINAKLLAGSLPGYLHSALAETYAHTGNIKSELAASEEALEAIAGGAERIWKAGVLSVRGDLLLAAGRQQEGETCLRQAIEVAREQGAQSLELRAATSLARFWSEHGRRHEARDLLGPIYGWFTEGFDTPDLKDARALLDELNAGIGKAEIAR